MRTASTQPEEASSHAGDETGSTAGLLTAPSPAPALAARRRDALGWAAVILLTLGVLASWGPFWAPFGDDHDGRIMGRHAIQVENLQEKGLIGSGFGSDLRPFSQNYSHHPPLMTAVYAFADGLPGSTESSLRLVSYGMGALTLLMMAGVLRRLRIGWAAVMPAVALTAATPLFWAYGRLHGPFALAVALAWAVVDLRERDQPEQWRVIGTAVLAVAVVLSNWFGMATAALLGLWLFSRRRFDRATWTVGSAMVIAAALTWAFVLLTPDKVGVVQQAEFRTVGGGFTSAMFIERMGRWLTELLPLWYRLLAIPAVIAGLVVRRTRWLTAMTAVLAVGWVLLFPNGSYIHDYWIFPLLLPVGLGLAGLGAAITERLPGPPRALATVAVTGVAVLMLTSMATGDVAQRYVEDPRDAGELAQRAPVPATQRIAWHSQSIPGPRWLAYEWDLWPTALDPEWFHAVQPADLVLLRLDRPAPWMPDDAVIEDLLIDREGRYGLARAADLIAAADGDA